MNPQLTIDAKAKATIVSELRPGERLLWAGRPARPPIFMGAIFVTLFGSVWFFLIVTTFLAGLLEATNNPADLSQETAETATGAVAGFGILGFILIFVLVGVAMMFSGLYFLIAPSREVYGITNQRGIVISPFIRYRIASLTPQVLKLLERKGRGDRATLVFGAGLVSLPPRNGSPFGTELTSFHNIPNARTVETLIYNTFHAEELPHEQATHPR